MVDLNEIQNSNYQFIKSRKWDRFTNSLIFTHLVEEIGEIGKYILYNEKYKVEGAGHTMGSIDIGQEFAQVFNLLLQLASNNNIDLQAEWISEIKRMEARFSVKIWEELAEE